MVIMKNRKNCGRSGSKNSRSAIQTRIYGWRQRNRFWVKQRPQKQQPPSSANSGPIFVYQSGAISSPTKQQKIVSVCTPRRSKQVSPSKLFQHHMPDLDNSRLFRSRSPTSAKAGKQKLAQMALRSVQGHNRPSRPARIRWRHRRYVVPFRFPPSGQQRA